MTWIETFSGEEFSLLALHPPVRADDIAHSLAINNRFTGHTLRPYSVAEHALHVCHRVASLYPGPTHVVLHALSLHHDSHEYVTGDMSAPMKLLLRQMCGQEESDLDRIEKSVQGAILSALGLPQPTEEQRKIIKQADLHMLKIERWSLMPNTGRNAWGTNEGQPEGWRYHRLNNHDDWWNASPGEIERRFRLCSEALLGALPAVPVQQ